MKNNMKAFISAANDLEGIVEGVWSVNWTGNNKRLKDTKEWCAFYTALAVVKCELDANSGKNGGE